MLARVTVSDEAIGSAHGLSRVRLVQLHEELALMLLAHGVLVFGYNGHGAFKNALERLGTHAPNAKKAWDVALPRARTEACPRTVKRLDDISTCRQLASHWRKRADVAVCDEHRAVTLGLPAGKQAYLDPTSDVEIALIDALWQISRFRRLRELTQDQTIRRGESRQVAWRDRFLPLAAHSQQIVILDRYVGKNALTKSGGETIEWFLREVRRTERASTITFITCAGGKGMPKAATIVARLGALAAKALAGSRVRSVKVTLAPVRAKQFTFPHDRHVRFDHNVLELSAGLDRFKPRIGETFTCVYGWHPAHTRKARDHELRVSRYRSAVHDEAWH